MSVLDVPEDALVVEALEAGGWTAGRVQDTSAWERWYSDEGYAANPDVLRLLRSLGNLTITPPRRDDCVFFSGPVLFDPAAAATGARELVLTREHELGQRLWPIGEWSGVYILLYGENGSVFADGASLGLLLLGKTIAEALSVLVKADHRPETVLE